MTLFSLLLLGFSFNYVQAQWPMAVAPNPGSKPVSKSYEQALACFPTLKDERISFKVDLNKLKDVIDDRFVTSHSFLRQRKIHYRDSEGQLMNLVLRNKTLGSGKTQSDLTLQVVDSKGVVTEAPLTANQKKIPVQDMINQFLLNAEIKSDEYSYHDTKLNGLVMKYLRNFRDVMEVELVESKGKRSLTCESKIDLGIICRCVKK